MCLRENQKILTPDERQEVRKLERELDKTYDRLAAQPASADLSRRTRELEIKIVRITREPTIDY